MDEKPKHWIKMNARIFLFGGDIEDDPNAEVYGEPINSFDYQYVWQTLKNFETFKGEVHMCLSQYRWDEKNQIKTISDGEAFDIPANDVLRDWFHKLREVWWEILD